MNYEIYKGQTWLKSIYIEDAEGNKIDLVPGDKVEFALKKNIHDTDYIEYQEVTTFSNGIATIFLSHADTFGLEVLVYDYDIKLTYGNKTLYQVGKFKVKMVVNNG